MANDNNKCWYCHQGTMKPAPEVGEGWFKCPKCGATELPNPTTLGAPSVILEQVGPGKYDTKYRPRRRKLPKTETKKS